MPTDFFTREQIDSSNAIPLTVRGETVGFVDRETYEEMDSPDYVKMQFETGRDGEEKEEKEQEKEN